MSDVWDRASEVIARRIGGFAAIALLLAWLPGVVRGVAQAAALPAGAGAAALVGGLVGLAAALLGVLAHLALVALALDPALSWGAAVRVGVDRFGAYLGVILPLAVALLLLAAPIGIAAAASYPSIAAMQAGGAPTVSPGTGAFIGLYGIVLAVVVIWAQARLMAVLVPVVVAERRGLAAYRRAMALTRGLTWRIVGVVLLFAILVAVVLLATRSVVFVALRLMLGAEDLALAVLLTGAAVSLVACAAWVAAAAFAAKLYQAVREGEE